jgi:ABC-type sugar transport system, periplasmic component
VSPCNVVYFYGIKGTPIDTAVKLGWDEVTASNPDITVVAEAEGQYLGPDVALAAMQDVLQRTDDIDVVTGPDQAMVGAQLALSDAGLSDIKIIGFGGSEVAIEAVSSGAWFGDVFGAPFTEGTLAMEAMVAALRDGTVTGGVNPLAEFPNGGLVTADNVADFTPQWAG